MARALPLSNKTSLPFPSPTFQPWPSYDPQRPQVGYDTDAAFHSLYDEAQTATEMNDRAMRRQRHYLIPQAIRQVRNVPGYVAEVGCYRGLSAYITCSAMIAEGISCDFHIFDSFEGLSSPNEHDATEFKSKKIVAGNTLACPEDQVRRNLARFDFVQYHRGWIPDCFPGVAEKTFRYVHVDVDLYQPTIDTLKFFWPRLSPRGVMLLDDNGTLFFPGARKAIDEFFSERNDVVRFETPSGAGIAIKMA